MMTRISKMNIKISVFYTIWCVNLINVLQSSFAVAEDGNNEEYQREIYLAPRNFNPHPYEYQLAKIQDPGPVVFPQPEEDDPSFSNRYNIITVDDDARIKSLFPNNENAYSKLTTKFRYLVRRRHEGTKPIEIDNGVYNTLTHQGVKVLAYPAPEVFNNYANNPNPIPKKNYAFSYKVLDKATGDDFSHQQVRNSKATNGEYRVKLPDGRLQIVSYKADKNGYKADVRYEIDPEAQQQIIQTTAVPQLQYIPQKVEITPVPVRQLLPNRIKTRPIKNYENYITDQSKQHLAKNQNVIYVEQPNNAALPALPPQKSAEISNVRYVEVPVQQSYYLHTNSLPAQNVQYYAENSAGGSTAENYIPSSTVAPLYDYNQINYATTPEPSKIRAQIIHNGDNGLYNPNLINNNNNNYDPPQTRKTTSHNNNNNNNNVINTLSPSSKQNDAYRETLEQENELPEGVYIVGKTVHIFGIILIVSSETIRQQYFRVQPHDFKVHEGGEAMLECEIANLAGQVQWTKDGFALGFSSVIPGYPRYSVIGERRNGVYNLRISNGSLEDDAEYQCQVGPTKMSKAIRANARLTVISPPSSVEILEHRHNSKIEIKENQEFHLECRVRNAKPAAKIVWYRGNVEINIPNREDQTIEILAKNGDRRVTRYDTHSRITLKPTPEDDHTSYTCEARHEALSQDLPMRATVQLSVLYPPGLPYIEGYMEGETIKRGQLVELVCRSRGGNPPAQLIWYKNGEQIRMAYRTAGRVSENVFTFTADASDNKARYRCEASNIMSKSPFKAEIDMTVLFAPAHVTISGPTEARIGDPVPLTCTTANSNPPADIKWMVAGRQVRNATSRTMISPEGGWITTSNITAIVEPNRRSLVVICHGVNMQLTENVVSTHTINVLYPPSQPFIHGYTESTPIPAGAVQSISCTSSGGNPLATLTWYKNDKKIHSTIKTSDKAVSAEITIRTNVTDNNARYRCEAANSATEIPLFETITMSVHFPPETVRIRQEPNELRPGDEATLFCDSSSSNPPAQLSWWREGIPVQGYNNYSKPGLHGGTVSTIELKINVSEESNGLQYDCQAQNEALQRSAHDAITLQVLYKPIFDKTNEEVVTGVEDEPLIITLKANGNPENIAYTWTKDGLPITRVSTSNGGERTISDDGVLNITKLSRHDAGIYNCEALNSQGSAMASVNITVQYSASIIQTSETVVANPKEDATLSCTADGNPLTEDTITWKRDGFPDFEARTSVMYDKNGTSQLRITQVTREDLGEFQCVASNGVGNSTTKNIMLIVKHKPEIDESPNLLKFASEAGDTAKMICKSRASPLAKYTWARNGNPISANNSGRYFTTYNQIDQLTSESILYINHVTSSDYGTYECIARNELGFKTISPKLELTSAPDIPTLLLLLNVTHDSATLAWTPGFDGGMQPFYRIRYRKVNENSYKYEDVTPANATTYVINKLEMDTHYLFSIMASNKLGNSNYMPDMLAAKTSTFEGDQVEKLLPQDLMEKEDLSRIMIISVSVIGVVLLIINIGLVAGCMLKRRAKRIREQSNQTGKSATIEMYAPSSYNDTMTGETLSSVSEKSETYSNEGSHTEYVDDSRSKQAPNSYIIEQPPPVDYPPGAYPVYEMQMGNMNNMAHKTHTLPHPHHHHHHHHMMDTRPRSRDDHSLGHYGPGMGMSAKTSYVSAPTPTPPADGSYYNMSDRYLSYPPPLDFQNPPPIPAHPHLHNMTPLTPPLPSSNGSLLRHQRHVPPPDVLHNTSQNAQILQAQTLTQKRELSSFGNGYGVNEQEGHLV